jgi:23S rRNA pseudouridine2605 synthase
MSESERIAKAMARMGACSRRDAERFIAAGRVQVNGKVIDSPVVFVTESDSIMLDNTALQGKAPTQLWRYYKPRGLITSNTDPEGRPTVFDALPETLPRVMSVGRLDLNSEGLLLLTNNGELARYLEHPDTGWARNYRVRMRGEPSQDTIRALKKGVEVESIRYRAISVRIEKAGENSWAKVTLNEGKNREIRRVFEHFGHPVSRLIRTSYGPFQLGKLEEGKVEIVKHSVLKNAVGNKFNM